MARARAMTVPPPLSFAKHTTRWKLPRTLHVPCVRPAALMGESIRSVTRATCAGAWLATTASRDLA
eukprot:603879-Prymnesium_polylepis.2